MCVCDHSPGWYVCVTTLQDGMCVCVTTLQDGMCVCVTTLQDGMCVCDHSPGWYVCGGQVDSMPWEWWIQEIKKELEGGGALDSKKNPPLLIEQWEIVGVVGRIPAPTHSDYEGSATMDC